MRPSGGGGAIVTTSTRASGGIGRRAGFRCQWPQGRGGSSPPSPTTDNGPVVDEDTGDGGRAARERYGARVRGCLLGGAIGDALGAPVEFWSLDRIRSVVGPDGVR